MDLKKLMKTSDSIGLAVLRVVTGAVFMAHGLPKLGLMGDGSLAATTERLYLARWQRAADSDPPGRIKSFSGGRFPLNPSRSDSSCAT